MTDHRNTLPMLAVGDIVLCVCGNQLHGMFELQAGRIYTVSAHVVASRKLDFHLLEVRDVCGSHGDFRFLKLAEGEPPEVVALANAILDVRATARRAATPADLEAAGFAPADIIEYGTEAAQLAARAVAAMPSRAA